MRIRSIFMLSLGLCAPTGLALAQEGGAPPPAQTAAGGPNENGPDPSGNAGGAAHGGDSWSETQKQVQPTKQQAQPAKQKGETKPVCPPNSDSKQ